MTYDRYICWPSDQKQRIPTIAQIQLQLLEYLDNAITRPPKVDAKCINVPLPGKNHTRYFDVQLLATCIVVTTQDADEFTRAVAEGFAELVARVFDGHVLG